MCSNATAVSPRPSSVQDIVVRFGRVSGRLHTVTEQANELLDRLLPFLHVDGQGRNSQGQLGQDDLDALDMFRQMLKDGIAERDAIRRRQIAIRRRHFGVQRTRCEPERLGRR